MALRERVAAYFDEGHGHREAARHFRVSPRFVNEFMRLRREAGSLEPRRQGHAPGSGKLAPHVDFVRRRMARCGSKAGFMEATLAFARQRAEFNKILSAPPPLWSGSRLD